MSYVIFHFATGTLFKSYNTRRGALIGLRAVNRNAGFAHRYTVCNHAGAVREWAQGPEQIDYAPYAMSEENNYYQNHVKTRVVKNLMTGADVKINSNTPLCCDPSSETYWSC